MLSESAMQVLKKHKQEHLVQHLPQLTHPQAAALADHIAAIDFDALSEAFSLATSTKPSQTTSDVISPAACVSAEELRLHAWEWRNRGLVEIAQGRVAAVCLAGGQGSRLGFEGPKGAFDAEFPSAKSLFQLHAERLLRTCTLAGKGAVIPLYVMTSPLNDEDTKMHFESNKFFGLDPAHVMFFAQGTLPCLSEQGKVLLESPHVIASAPDGNGGVYAALSKSGALLDMERRGVTCMHFYAVDNALASPADALFMGACISKGVEAGNLCVPKLGWDERVGVAAMRNGKFHVVEYSEITQDMAKQVDPASGRLLFGSANICSHFFSLDFIRDVVVPGMRLHHHVARKAIPHLDDPSPTKPNGIKLELFIFDAMPMAKMFLALEVDRAEVFAPIKNASGVDSPQTARDAVTQLHSSWLVKAGAALEGSGLCEVSSLVSLDGEGLEFVSGKTLRLPLYLGCLESEPVPVLGQDARTLILNIMQTRPGIHTYSVLGSGNHGGNAVDSQLLHRLAKVDIAKTTPLQAMYILEELLAISSLKKSS